MKFYTLLFCLLTATIYTMDKEETKNLHQKLKALEIKTIQLIMQSQEENCEILKAINDDARSSSPTLNYDQKHKMRETINEQNKSFLAMLPLIEKTLSNTTTQATQTEIDLDKFSK